METDPQRPTELPYMRVDEIVEFSHFVDKCGIGATHKTESEFRDWIQILREYPEIEYRIQIVENTCYVFVRERDWKAAVTEKGRRKSEEGRKLFWKEFPKLATTMACTTLGTAIAGIFLTAIFPRVTDWTKFLFWCPCGTVVVAGIAGSILRYYTLTSKK